jgi:uncharacterized membrane protein SpoIIM required for sporulation
MSLPLWSFVAPHGVLELPAIFIAGGAGLRLGQGLLFPGVLPRKDSLARAGTQAIKLVIGTVPLLIIAGIVEAFISPTDLPVVSKFAVAASLAVLLAIYLSSSPALRHEEHEEGTRPTRRTEHSERLRSGAGVES